MHKCLRAILWQPRQKTAALFFALFADAECKFEAFEEIFLAKPFCKDEIRNLYDVSLAMAKPNDKMTIEDAFGYWKRCKSKPWLLLLTIMLDII